MRGLTGCWHFDETSGDIADDCSANNRDFQFQAAPPWGTGAQCYLNGCARNTGSITGQYASPGANILAFGSASLLSFSVWVQLTGTVQTASEVYELPPVVADPSGYIGLYWGKIGAGAESLHAYSWDTGVTRVTGAYTQGTKVHVAFVHGSGKLHLYINGVEQQVVGGVNSGNTNASAGNLTLWGNALSSVCTDCMTDELYFYNVELTPAEVETLAGVTPTGPSASSGRRRILALE
jgi:Ca2+-binding RTX toxin-like protein